MKDCIIMFFDKEPKSLIISLLNKYNYNRQDWSKYICGLLCDDEYMHIEMPGKLDCAIIPLHPESRTCININKEYVRIHTLQSETILMQEIQECINDKNLSIICEYDD
ncbi:MAG: hypothetical protein VZS44_08680 [Bacilli bacterium]|nr:hypothetical protein [Bacilli bacterium]